MRNFTIKTVFIFIFSTFILGCSTVSNTVEVLDKQNVYHGHYFKFLFITPEKGVNLEEIASKYNISLDLLYYINNIKYPYNSIPNRIIVPIDVPSKKGDGSDNITVKKVKPQSSSDKGISHPADPFSNEESAYKSDEFAKSVDYPNDSHSNHVKNTDGNRDDGNRYDNKGDVNKKDVIQGGSIENNSDGFNSSDIHHENDDHDDFIIGPKNNYKFRTPMDSPDFAWPIQGKVLRHFHEQPEEFNEGITISAPLNTIVRASGAGKVVYSGFDQNQFGNLLIIQHDNGMYTAYAHNNALLAEKGQTVIKGEPIAKVGKTGKADKPQLYFSVRRDNIAIDPEKIPPVSKGKKKSTKQKGIKVKNQKKSVHR